MVGKKSPQRIKKFILLFIAVSLLCCGCGSKNNENSEPEMAKEETEITVLKDDNSQIQTPGTDLQIIAFQTKHAADAFLLQTQNGAVLIDTGEKNDGKRIARILKANGIEKLDCLILTHFDKDHVGGAEKILDKIQVEQILQTRGEKDSKEYEQYSESIEQLGITPSVVTEKTVLSVDEVVYVIYPPERFRYAKDNSNNSSLVVAVFNGQNSFLFMGDAEEERIAEVLEYDVQQVDCIKMPHHGRWHDNLDALLQKTTPRYAIINDSKEEPGDVDVANLLKQYNIETLLTKEGDILMESDGKADVVLP